MSQRSLVSFLASSCVYSCPFRPPAPAQTEDMQWTYEVRGTHPHFVAPQAVSHIDDRLPRELEAKLSMGKKTTTNYMRQNLLTLRQDSKDVKAKRK